MDQLIVDDADGVRTITINRPEVKNALTAAMRSRFCALIEESDVDDAVRAVIVTAADPVFSAGVDFKEVAAGSGSPSSSNPGAALRAATTPVVCAVNGACVTGALELALSCTFIVASERARFADTHARVGIMPGGGITVLLARSIGLPRAIEMSLTGNFVAADEALRLGLVNHVVPHEELLPFARGLAADIVSNDQTGVRRLLEHYRRIANAATLDEAHLIEGYMAEQWTRDAAALADRRQAVTERGREQQG
jgi:enoyl-CoA hydratase